MAGDGIEVDKSRQLLLIVRDGQVQWAINTSTETERPYVFEGQRYLADTPKGTSTVERPVDGWRVAPLGRLYRPKFLVGGIAIHRYSHVPATPVSHGCIRVANGAMDFLWEASVAPRLDRLGARHVTASDELNTEAAHGPSSVGEPTPASPGTAAVVVPVGSPRRPDLRQLRGLEVERAHRLGEVRGRHATGVAHLDEGAALDVEQLPLEPLLLSQQGVFVGRGFVEAGA
jgi:hypothetical protein